MRKTEIVWFFNNRTTLHTYIKEIFHCVGLLIENRGTYCVPVNTHFSAEYFSDKNVIGSETIAGPEWFTFSTNLF